MADWTLEEIAGMIDHSLLNPRLTDAELQAGCEWAAAAGVASVCIKPYAVRLAARVLGGAGPAVGTVVGFPHGGHTTATKLFEAQQAMQDGATELDVVVNIGKALSEDWHYVRRELSAVVAAAHEGGALVKVILETSMLADPCKIRLCELASEARADFVKTSTGYGEGGATDHDLKLLRAHAAPEVQVKAAGGVRSLARLLEVRALGATRVGATASKSILDEALAALERA